jgi:HK97 gp10 family phage protein
MAKEFTSLGDFAMHLVKVQTAVKVAEHQGLKRIAQLIETTAKEELGTYQDEVGHFPAWAPLAESTERHKERMGYPADSPLVATGEMRDNISHVVKGTEAVIGSPDERAIFQEMGTSTIPPRPFLGPAVYRNKERIEKIIGRAVVAGIMDGAILPGGEKYFMGE